MSKYNFHLPNKPATKSGSILSYDYSDNRTFIPQPLTFSRGSNATYIDKDGLVKSTTGDLPRVNGQDGALLLEPSSTNKVTQSETFSTWSTQRSTLTSVSLTNPSGGSQSVKFASNDISLSEKTISKSVSNSGNNTASIFAKKGEVDKILYRANTNNWKNTVFDLDNGTIVTVEDPTRTSAKIEDFGNGWYRCSVTITVAQPVYQNFWLLSDSDSSPHETTIPIGDGLYIWGAQYEDNSFATSYIPTTTTTATRLAETAINAGTEGVFNSEEGVFYAEVSANVDGGHRQITISDGSIDNRVMINTIGGINNTIRGQVRVSNSVVFEFNFNSGDITQFHKVAIKYKQNYFAMWVDGVEVATDTIGNAPVGLDRLGFNQGLAGNDFYGKVKELKVFNKALTDAELQQLTTQ